MIDLHSHTTASDGTLTPTELIDYAISKGLTALAITDHDTIDGLIEARNYLNTLDSDLILINGIEFSTNIPKYNFDIHMLAYNVDPGNKAFTSGLDAVLADRYSRNDKMIAKINELGYSMSKQELKDYSGDSVITRAHMAKVLVNKGYFKTTQEVFEILIGNGGPAYYPRTAVHAKNAIDLINRTGAVSAIAHPTLYGLDQNGLYGLISELKDYGLQGIESFYSLYDSTQHAHMRNLADKFDLLEFGGSDFHGANKAGLDLGNGYGNLNVPDSLLKPLL